MCHIAAGTVRTCMGKYDIALDPHKYIVSLVHIYWPCSLSYQRSLHLYSIVSYLMLHCAAAIVFFTELHYFHYTAAVLPVCGHSCPVYHVHNTCCWILTFIQTLPQYIWRSDTIFFSGDIVRTRRLLSSPCPKTSPSDLRVRVRVG